VVSLPSGDGASAQNALVVDSLSALQDLVDAANCTALNAAPGETPSPSPSPGASQSGLPYTKCDDGLPDGRTGGARGIPVPAAYHATNGNDYTGLPAPATADEVAAVDADYDLQPDESGDRITLDVDVSLPSGRAPKGGYPVIVFMHGCCGGNKTSWQAEDVDVTGEKWHHSNAYFAARGYVVLNYTARGFRNGNQAGSSGTTQLDSRRFEINDFQYLVGLLVDDDAAKRAAGETPVFNVNPRKVAAVGGSYGGGFTWLALTDPTWKSPMNGKPIRLAAAVAKYGWTDLLESLVPSGHYQDYDASGKTVVAPSDPAKAPSRTPIGVEKQSIVSGLYATGNAVSGNHTTFPQYLHEAFAMLQAGEPYDANPALQEQADQFLNDRSAYYQNAFWSRVQAGLRVPVYSAATWTDPLFPTMEHMRFYNKLKSIAPNYPIVTYLGDFQHFVQNKAKEWNDLCGDDNHICKYEDYATPRGALSPYRSPSRVRLGINTRISKFLDYYLKGTGKKPANNVTSTTTICPATASEKYPEDEPGIEHRAPTWRKLAPRRQTFAWGGGGAGTTTTTSSAADAHSTGDPVATNGTTECFSPQDANPGPGVVQLVSDPIGKPFTLMGIPKVKLDFSAMGTDYWLTARLYDQDAEGTLHFVTRGVCRFTDAVPGATCDTFDLWGNAWTFEKDHRVLMELSQGDTPTFRRDNFPSSLQFGAAEVTLPVAPKKLRRDFRS
jgi:predicted acyl esterase